jgi:diguanylate cyclase (GGDEF)-like protein
MRETATTELAWRFDSVAAHAASSEIYEATKAVAVAERMCSAVDPVAERITPTNFLKRWKEVVRTWANERLRRLSVHSARFEDIVHEFTEIVETAHSAGAVEAALLRQARRTVPACRVELIMGPAPASFPDVTSVDGGTGSGGQQSDPTRGSSGQSIMEVPLRYGSAVRGRLRVRSRTGGGALRNETVRRLTTLCAMGACALERLGRCDEWPGDDDLANLGVAAKADVTLDAARTGAASGATPRSHDATFLNAVLPFALNQARRHNEPLSLVCVAIDRLGGIRELLGAGAADRLVRDVADTLASLIRASDIVARLDDDRVVAVLPRAPGGGALHVAQKVCKAIAEKRRSDCEISNITVSIGVATFPACADNVLSLFDAADEALARAQSQGRNQASLAPRRLARALGQAASCPK